LDGNIDSFCSHVGDCTGFRSSMVRGHLPRGRRLVATAVAPHVAGEDVAPTRAFRAVPKTAVSNCNELRPAGDNRHLAAQPTGLSRARRSRRRTRVLQPTICASRIADHLAVRPHVNNCCIANFSQGRSITDLATCQSSGLLTTRFPAGQRAAWTLAVESKYRKRRANNIAPKPTMPNMLGSKDQAGHEQDNGGSPA